MYGSLQLTAKSVGLLTLPSSLKRGLALVPGDILSVQHFPLSVQLEIYREFLADRWELVAPEARREYLGQFLLRTLTAIDAKGRLLIPPDAGSFPSPDFSPVLSTCASSSMQSGSLYGSRETPERLSTPLDRCFATATCA